jgi:hypothetical protein
MFQNLLRSKNVKSIMKALKEEYCNPEWFGQDAKGKTSKDVSYRIILDIYIIIYFYYYYILHYILYYILYFQVSVCVLFFPILI